MHCTTRQDTSFFEGMTVILISTEPTYIGVPVVPYDIQNAREVSEKEG
jgi:hypothetical protein